ncbi:MAG: RloB domain-containing protein [Treponema bryantii]|nr:RloB domain-containing protein [Treponema bryantii]
MRVSQPYGERYIEKEFSQEPKIRYFIACEGEKTEYRYFKGIIEFRTEIGINPLVEIIPIRHEQNTSSNPVNIYKDAKLAIENASNFLDGDKLCIVVDRDKQSFTDSQFDVLLNAERDNEIKFCISNPCFEFWLLLHFSDCSEYDMNLLCNNEKEGNRTFVEKCLMEKLGGSYNKTRLKFSENYKGRIKLAIENAKKYSLSAEELKNNIGTTVALLIDEMLEQ